MGEWPRQIAPHPDASRFTWPAFFVANEPGVLPVRSLAAKLTGMNGLAFDDLIADAGPELIRPAAQPITEMTDDSRRVASGCVFVARGRADATSDGDGWRAWVVDACAAGAAAVVAPAAVDVPDGVGLAVASVVDQPLAAELAARFFGHPARGLKLVGITGTNGKTTVATITQHLLKTGGMRCGLLGTVAIDDGGADGPQPAELTTPGAIELQRVFACMVANGCAAAVMEVSSHALDQGRVAGLDFDVAVFTNLTQDHLDYHGTMAAYAAAKAKLFAGLRPDATAVINVDGDYEHEMSEVTAGRLCWTSTVLPGGGTYERGSTNYMPVGRAVEMRPGSSLVELQGPWGTARVSVPLVGLHNLSNVLQAVCAADAIEPFGSEGIERLRSLLPVPGRLEPVTFPGIGRPGDAPAVLVDYAHTPDALVNVLGTLRPLTPGRLICVFGCGGDRDRTKRPRMARAAADGADVLILTSDNPRTEDPQQILGDAAAGVPAERRGALTVEIDRAKAIAAAVAGARPDDTVLIAGKGHEDYQIIGTTRTHFDDREEAARALARWSG